MNSRAGSEVPPVPDLIAESWKRASRSGLSPSTCLGLSPLREVDPAAPLLRGAAPVLEELEEDLRGSSYSTLLVDRDCRVVRRWCDDPRVERGFDAVNVAVGASLLEDYIGTNAPGTAYTTRRTVTVNGEEHFAEALRSFSCYGHPIKHPLTKRIEGVLDVSVLAVRANPLLRPLIPRAVRDIEQRLLDGSRVSDRHLMLAFRSAAAKSGKAVVALGDDVVTVNRRAQDMLTSRDLTQLQVLVSEDRHREQAVVELELESGMPVDVQVEHVAGAPHSALLRLAPGHRRRPPPTADAPERRSDLALLITGAPGTGRTTRARERVAEHAQVRTLHPSLALLEGEAAWARQFEDACARGQGAVVVEGVDVLPDALVGLIRDRLPSSVRPALVLTSGPVATLSGDAASLAAAVPSHEELVPLAARRHEIPDLAIAMLRELSPHCRVHFAQSLLKTLAFQPWLGNLHELRSVVAALAARRSAGALTVDDLPARYRTPPGDRGRLNARDLAERDVITAVLRELDGNKVRAAEKLCMSRTTLYARMRSLKITSY